MFSKVAILLTAALAAVSATVASPLAQEGTPKCNSGPVQCCGTLSNAKDASALKQLSLLGISVENLTGQIGFQCNPITVIGAGAGANCASSPVCCENNFQNQLVGINCSPITIQA